MEATLFNCSPVYYANSNSSADIVINQGGTDSGKTYAIVQLLYYKAITEPLSIITIVGESIPNLKKGAYRIAGDIYNASKPLQAYIEDWNKTDRIITFKNGSIIEFTSYQTEQDAKQGKRQYSFFNEANGVSWQIFWQVAKRTRKQTFIDYNPSAPFWAHDSLIGTNGENDLSASVQLIISDHRHNPFLTDADHRKTENIKDPQLWRVYARGLTGNLEGIIYNNWQIIQDELFHKICKEQDNFFGGLDFGYTNDPTVGVKMVRTAAGLYVHEMFYETGLGAKQIVNHLNSNGWTKTARICCDSADPEMISEIKRLGIKGAIGARKGPGSILAGINHLKGQKVFVTASSANIIEERKRYVWEKDKETGKPINEPTDQYNHAMDAIRYGHYTMYFRERSQ